MPFVNDFMEDSDSEQELDDGRISLIAGALHPSGSATLAVSTPAHDQAQPLHTNEENDVLKHSMVTFQPQDFLCIPLVRMYHRGQVFLGSLIEAYRRLKDEAGKHCGSKEQLFAYRERIERTSSEIRKSIADTVVRLQELEDAAETNGATFMNGLDSSIAATSCDVQLSDRLQLALSLWHLIEIVALGSTDALQKHLAGEKSYELLAVDSQPLRHIDVTNDMEQSQIGHKIIDWLKDHFIEPQDEGEIHHLQAVLSSTPHGADGIDRAETAWRAVARLLLSGQLQEAADLIRSCMIILPYDAIMHIADVLNAYPMPREQEPSVDYQERWREWHLATRALQRRIPSHVSTKFPIVDQIMEFMQGNLDESLPSLISFGFPDDKDDQQLRWFHIVLANLYFHQPMTQYSSSRLHSLFLGAMEKCKEAYEPETVLHCCLDILNGKVASSLSLLVSNGQTWAVGSLLYFLHATGSSAWSTLHPSYSLSLFPGIMVDFCAELCQMATTFSSLPMAMVDDAMDELEHVALDDDSVDIERSILWYTPWKIALETATTSLVAFNLFSAFKFSNTEQSHFTQLIIRLLRTTPAHLHRVIAQKVETTLQSCELHGLMSCVAANQCSVALRTFSAHAVRVKMNICEGNLWNDFLVDGYRCLTTAKKISSVYQIQRLYNVIIDVFHTFLQVQLRNKFFALHHLDQMAPFVQQLSDLLNYTSDQPKHLNVFCCRLGIAALLLSRTALLFSFIHSVYDNLRISDKQVAIDTAQQTPGRANPVSISQSTKGESHVATSVIHGVLVENSDEKIRNLEQQEAGRNSTEKMESADELEQLLRQLQFALVTTIVELLSGSPNVKKPGPSNSIGLSAVKGLKMWVQPNKGPIDCTPTSLDTVSSTHQSSFLRYLLCSAQSSTAAVSLYGYGSAPPSVYWTLIKICDASGIFDGSRPPCTAWQVQRLIHTITQLGGSIKSNPSKAHSLLISKLLQSHAKCVLYEGSSNYLQAMPIAPTSSVRPHTPLPTKDMRVPPTPGPARHELLANVATPAPPSHNQAFSRVSGAHTYMQNNNSRFTSPAQMKWLGTDLASPTAFLTAETPKTAKLRSRAATPFSNKRGLLSTRDLAMTPATRHIGLNTPSQAFLASKERKSDSTESKFYQISSMRTPKSFIQRFDGALSSVKPSRLRTPAAAHSLGIGLSSPPLSL